MTNRHNYEPAGVALFIVFSVSLATSVFSQVVYGDLKEKLLKLYAENAEKIEIAGVEYQGHKTGSTKFTKCNGDVIDIGDKKPKKAGPCPSEGGPRSIRRISGSLGDVDDRTSSIEIIEETGGRHRLFLPSGARLISGGSIGEPGEIRLSDIKGATRVVVYSVLEGRIEAIAYR